MKIYCFMVEISPSESNPDYQKVGEGVAHVMVTDTSMEKASQRAMSYLFEHCWLVQGDVTSLELTSQLAAMLDEVLYPVYLKAQRFGIGAVFEVGKRVPGNPDDPVEIHIRPSLFPPKDS